MKKAGAMILVAILAAPSLMSAQSMGHRNGQGQMQMQQMQMHQMQQMQEMSERMARMHEELAGLQHQMGQQMSGMGQMGEAQQRQHQMMQGMMGAMSEMANQLRSAMTQMMQMSQDETMAGNESMGRDMEQLQEHMRTMAEAMEGSLEALRRMHEHAGGGGGVR